MQHLQLSFYLKFRVQSYRYKKKKTHIIVKRMNTFLASFIESKIPLSLKNIHLFVEVGKGQLVAPIDTLINVY